ncbi:hypothetical protein [Streptomyces triticagri]|nr:hypothetical protein [Streptomyces triticagri]
MDRRLSRCFAELPPAERETEPERAPPAPPVPVVPPGAATCAIGTG